MDRGIHPARFPSPDPHRHFPIVNEENSAETNEETGRTLQPDRPAIDAESRFRANYIKLIRQKGLTSPQTKTNARKLGINVEALLAEREREIRARHVVELGLDLATLTLDPDGGTLESDFIQWKNRSVSLSAACLVVCLPGLGINGTNQVNAIPEVSVADLLRAGVQLIQGKLRDHPDEFRHTLPWGINDIELDRLVFHDPTKTWTLHGGQKPAALERTSRSLHPSRSIDLARAAAMEAPRVKAMPWPELEYVWLRILRWPSGASHVVDAYEIREEAGPDQAATHPDGPDTITLKYPSTGKFRWEELWATHPATHFLKAHSLRQAGDLAEDADQLGVEVIICDYSKPVPATDFRSSVRSGLHGPAPVPEGMAWPVCRNCGEIPSFWESLDFRDLGFHHLLPGTSLSIFVCDRCLKAGEPSLGTTLVWLPPEKSVELISIGDPMPLLEPRQWIARGPFAGRHSLPPCRSH